MPKIRHEELDDEDESFEDEDAEEADDEEDDLEMPAPKKSLKKAVKQKAEPKRRFGIVAPETMKIIDTETNEIIGDGEYAVLQALTNIIERLERIETQIGAISSS
jgi:hypothetical protein